MIWDFVNNIIKWMIKIKLMKIIFKRIEIDYLTKYLFHMM